MPASSMNDLLVSLLNIPGENEWLEWKVANAEPDEIGEYVSALSNSALLHGQNRAYAVWGVENGTRKVVGTTFRPRERKIGNEELENWIVRLLTPRIDFRFHEFEHQGVAVVILEIPSCWHSPVRFRDTEYIRVGSYKKKLRDFPEKERSLWRLLSREPFERGVALQSLKSGAVLLSLDYAAYFELGNQPIPDNETGILERLEREKLIERAAGDKWNITNLGAIVLARQLKHFDSLARRAVRVILYGGRDRIHARSEQVGTKGYAAGFKGLLGYINDRLPTSEELTPSLRRNMPMYPPVAVRELVANAIIHQDFAVGGASPMVEIFEDRIEITNPGTPLINPLRFIDEPPQSRNEVLASFMRRMGICEERGSGVDKVISLAEVHQLPAPDFLVADNHTRAVLFAARSFSKNGQERQNPCMLPAFFLAVFDR